MLCRKKLLMQSCGSNRLVGLMRAIQFFLSGEEKVLAPWAVPNIKIFTLLTKHKLRY